MRINILIKLALSSAFLLGVSSSAFFMTQYGSITVAKPSPTTSSPNTAIFSEDGIAIRGTDTVAYFTEGQPVPGSREFAYEWQGATWLFANAKHRDLFASNPDAYAPQYGGFCAYGVSQGVLVSIVPEAWSIVDGKLYLNYSATVQQQWQEDISGYIAQANQNWPTLISNKL